jgi:hypothetical protein
MWQEVPKSEQKTKNLPSTNFMRSYQPSGAQIQSKKFDDQQETINKFFIDDWTRRAFAYDTCFEGE